MFKNNFNFRIKSNICCLYNCFDYIKKIIYFNPTGLVYIIKQAALCPSCAFEHLHFFLYYFLHCLSCLIQHWKDNRPGCCFIRIGEESVTVFFSYFQAFIVERTQFRFYFNPISLTHLYNLFRFNKFF